MKPPQNSMRTASTKSLMQILGESVLRVADCLTGAGGLQLSSLRSRIIWNFLVPICQRPWQLVWHLLLLHCLVKIEIGRYPCTLQAKFADAIPEALTVLTQHVPLLLEIPGKLEDSIRWCAC